jgi:methionine-rich copper-binding protein CopC
VSNVTGRPTGAVRVLLGALLGATFLVASAMPASAHTALAASSPKDGGKIAVAPSQLQLEFTTPIYTSGFRVAVQGPDGLSYQAGAAQAVGNKLTQPLKPLGPIGLYRVQFRIVASDGHPLVSSMEFTLTKPGPAQGGAKATTYGPLSSVRTLTSANDAPGWAPWTGVAAVAIAAFGAVVFGRRVTRGLD